MHFLELLEDSSSDGAERSGVIAQSDDVAVGMRNAEESGGALLLERGGNLLRDHLELHLQINQVVVERVLWVATLSCRVYPFLCVEALAGEWT